MDFGFGMYFQFAVALIFVLSLIGILALVGRKFGLGYRVPPRSGRKRLGIVEIMPLDAKRRLVLISRDDTEHLVLLGPTSETVVERGIAKAEPDADFAATLAETAS